MAFLKSGKLVDRSQVCGMGVSVLVDGSKDQVDCGRHANSGWNCSGDGAAGSNGE